MLEAIVPMTKVAAAISSERSHANRWAMKAPLEAPTTYTRVGIDTQFSDQVIDHRGDEMHIVDALSVRTIA